MGNKKAFSALLRRSLQCEWTLVLSSFRPMLTCCSVTGACTGVTLILFIVYNNWALERVRVSHTRETLSPNMHETPIEMVKRKAQEPALEPGSVV